MKLLVLFLAFASSCALASGGPKEVTLNPELAKKLGFSIGVKNDGPGIMIELKGPKESPSGCPASRSGSYLLDESGDEIFVYITEIKNISTRPEAVGYYINKSHTMGVFIDYLCSGHKVLKSIRYTVPSVAEWRS